MRVSDRVVNALFVRWKVRLRLYNWNIVWCWAQEDDLDFKGKVRCVYGQEATRIQLLEELMEDFDKLRAVIIHELIHVRLNRHTQAVERLEDAGIFSQAAWRAFYDQFIAQLEYDTYDLERVFADLPAWKDDDLKPKPKGG